ncbi:MAG: NADP-dependent malic enzyme [Methylacidiphilales bacterium]|nr:NADP-dependent malic enzyme [Candidatus Methylacidiphilales bacterium]
MDDAKKIFKKQALEYHSSFPAGKLEICPTKSMHTSHDLSLAYSPGVAEPCIEISKDQTLINTYTSRSNLVGVITNGTAVLGLGDIGPYAAKPVMEGKAVLFKKFADINVFDLEIKQTSVEAFCDIVSSLEPTFGGINLEDIKSPECFDIERILQERMNIPVFHDDQHGTAIVVVAAFLNALSVVQKDPQKVKVCAVGIGAAGTSCLNMFKSVGVLKENIIACDEFGVIYKGRDAKITPPHKEQFALQTSLRTLSEAINGCDVFLGLSVGNICTQEMVKTMAPNPILFCLANPIPEINPNDVIAVRPDALCATGRSDFPNQVNNVLCFPFLFRGALDVGALKITHGMKIACAKAIAQLATREVDEFIAGAYGGNEMVFGRDYILPKPFDSRLVMEIAPAVALAAMKDGVATKPIVDIEQYRLSLERIVTRTSWSALGLRTKKSAKLIKVIFSEGEDHRVLRAAQSTIENKISFPILVGRKTVIEQYINRLNLRIQVDKDFQIVDPQDDPRYREYWESYHEIAGRKGVSIPNARKLLLTNQTVIGSLLLKKGEGDALVCGTTGAFKDHLFYIDQILGKENGIKNYCSVSVAFLKDQTIFIADTQVTVQPTVQELVEITELSIDVVRQFKLMPKIALLSHSSFGSSNLPQAVKMSDAVNILQKKYPTIAIDGEMMPDAALHYSIRSELLANNKLMHENANLLIMPDMDSASISFRLLKATSANQDVIASILAGCAYPAHILTNTVSSRSIFNITKYIQSKIESSQEKL